MNNRRLIFILILFVIWLDLSAQTKCNNGDPGGNPGCLDITNGCKVKIPDIKIPVVAPKDPNEIIGPAGYDTTIKWVSAKANLPYKILFENDPDFATAPAQKVVIYMPIHPNLNPNALRISDFGFGSYTFSVPVGTTAYTKRLDLRDSLGVFVDVTAGLDAANRRAFWVFESIDPATGLSVTLPPNSGFLPVNDSTLGNGEGYVSFTIQAGSSTHTGDSVSADATIVFDINEPLPTNIERNTLDAVAPVSKISALPPKANGTTINISWSGHDDPNGSGIRDYDLYVAGSSGAYSLYQKGIADTVTAFTGTAGNTYKFFTLATDNTGNQEAMKNRADATVQLGANCPEEICNGVDDDCDGLVDEGFTAMYFPDHDGDGFGAPTGGIMATTCNHPIGYVTTSSDCNDNDNTVYPGAPEICDGKDNNCNGQIDEGLTPGTYYQDLDGDGYGNPAVTLQSCSIPYGYVLNNRDCNDNDNTIYPGAPEICDGKDNNCNGQVDEGLTLHVYYRDADRDGYGTSDETITSCNATAPFGYSDKPGDCDDHSNLVYPGAPENCDGKDNNCNGQVDEEALFTFYRDEDGDGFGDSNSKIQDCQFRTGYVLFGGDCDDHNPRVNPLAAEICGNGIDDNCNGQVDEGCAVSPSPQNQVSALSTAPKTITGEVQVLQAKAVPNPTSYYFILYIQSGRNNSITIRVTDAVGRVIETKNNINVKGGVRIGQNYMPGLYQVEIIQGNEKVILKLVKTR